MATRFVRIDLSDDARDFRPIAIEPGLPLLDRPGSNAKILYRWLGGLVAEPAWEGESVNFFVRDDHGGRLEEVVCQSATGEDLQGSLKDDLATLKNRLEKARPETPMERALRQAVLESLQGLTAEANRTDLDCFFFRYRDVQGRWRLAWCWGYQRRDQEPAPAVVCTDPDCNLLFVRRPGKSPKCPSCAAALPAKSATSTGWKWAAAAMLLLLLLAGALLLWWPRPTEVKVAKGDGAITLSPRAAEAESKAAATSGETPSRHEDVRQRPPDGSGGSQPRGEAPVAVKILSDQGSAVRIPVGAAFDDFRVEAIYADGFTRLVTKKATLKIPEPPETAPVAAAEGRLLALRPGQTAVQAQFAGVASQQPLEVEVAGEIDLDEIRLAPAPTTLLRGETASLSAVGYKDGKSVGAITGRDDLAWQSSDSAVAEVNGPVVSGLSVGQAAVTARLGSIASRPAEVNVVDTIADPLVAEPKILRLRAGEAAQIGTEVVVLRGQSDVSGRCSVTPALTEVVRFAAETRSLVGVAPGASAVALALGDKLANLMVEVLPQSDAVDGTLLVEPQSGSLAPGQALPLRVFAVTATGERIDRTETAVFSSSDPAKVKMSGNRACAVAPGSAEITATLSGTDKSAIAQIAVNDEEISGLLVDPGRLEMSVGDGARLRILGRSRSGTYELFPQADLGLSVGGASPDAVRVDGAGEVTAVTPGKAVVKVAWRGRLSQQVPVAVTDSPLTDLRIEPAQATIHPDQPLVYQVTALRGGQRRALGPESGVRLSVGQQNVAELVGPLAVRGIKPGRTAVVARAGDQRAEAGLEVVAGTAAIESESGVAVGVPGSIEVYGPGYGYFGDRWHWRGGKWPTYKGWVGVRDFVERQARILSTPPAGNRFVKVTAGLNEGKESFDVSIEVLAAKTEGPLEYRVYAAGQSPAEAWVPAEPQDDVRRVLLRSPPVPYGPRGSLYHLMIEARDASGGTIQQYPLTFRLKEDIEVREGAEQGSFRP